MKKVILLVTAAIMSLAQIAAADVIEKTQAAKDLQAETISRAQNNSIDTQAALSAKDVVKKALGSFLKALSAQEKSTEYQKLQEFSGYFTDARVKQQVFLSLMMPKLTKFKILKETKLKKGMKVTVAATAGKRKQTLTFILASRNGQWLISKMK